MNRTINSDYMKMVANAKHNKIKLDIETKRAMLYTFSKLQTNILINKPIFKKSSIKVFTLFHICRGISIEQMGRGRHKDSKKHWVFVNQYEIISLEEAPKRTSIFDRFFK